MIATTKWSRPPGTLLLALTLGAVVGACFNPAAGRLSDGSGSVGCPPGTLGCPCDEAGLCIAGLVCEEGTCLDEPTVDTTTGVATSGMASSGTTMIDPSGVDSSGTGSDGGTTLGLDTGGSTGAGSTGFGSTGEASTGGESSSGGIPPVMVMETVDFPLATDPRLFQIGTRPWNAGDYVEGVRMTSVPTVSQLDIHIEFPVGFNGLSDCGFQEAQVMLNGNVLGTFTVAMGDMTIDQTYAAPNVPGPAYTIRYETTTTVESGCGSAGYGEVGSTVTLYE